MNHIKSKDIKHMRFLVFDTETTGLPPRPSILSQETLHLWPHIVQFSYVIYDSSCNHLAESKDYIIKIPEDITISEESCKLHKITKQMSMKKGVPIEKVLSEFFHHLKYVDVIIGHNIEFDLKMVQLELLRIIYEYPMTYRQSRIYRNHLYSITHLKDVYCTMKNSVSLCNIRVESKNDPKKTYVKFPKLFELHQCLFHTTPSDLHNSLNDILVTLRCFVKMEHDNDLFETSSSFKRVTSSFIHKKIEI